MHTRGLCGVALRALLVRWPIDASNSIRAVEPLCARSAVSVR